jgi:ATP-dependent Lon protease
VTGQLGDVMKESVNIAFSWIKAHLEDLTMTGSLNQQLTNIEKNKYLE